MNITLTPLTLLLAFSSSVGLFLSTSLLYKGKRMRIDQLVLSILILVLVSQLVKYIALATSPTVLPKQFYLISQFTLFLYGPLLLLYIKSLSPDFKLRKSLWLKHFVPFIFFFGLMLTFNEGTLTTINAAAAKNPAKTFFLFMTTTALSLVHISWYLVVVIKEVREYHKRLRTEFSSVEKAEHQWLRILAFAVLFVILLAVTYFALLLFGQVYLARTNINFLMAICLSIVTLILAFKATHLQQAPKMEIPNGSTHSPHKREVSPLLHQHLLKVMAQEKPYLNSDLRLGQLSEITSIKHHELSELINEKFGHNFFDFINSYRVEEVKRKLHDFDPKTNSILTIAYDSGFNSKSAFNRAFKKATGLSPTEYLKQTPSD